MKNLQRVCVGKSMVLWKLEVIHNSGEQTCEITRLCEGVQCLEVGMSTCEDCNQMYSLVEDYTFDIQQSLLNAQSID